jgi:hypothetical protein
MALSELAALEAAYDILRPLDLAGRRRALQWLSDALGGGASPEAPAAEASASTPPKATRRRRRPEPAAEPVPSRTRRRRTTATAVTPAGRSRRTQSARQRATANVEAAGRPYRRMPPAAEVMAAYEQVGSVSGLADHFGVPSHTVQGWARQLRKQGYTIGRTR